MTWKTNRWSSRKVKKFRSIDYERSKYSDYADDPYVYRYHPKALLQQLRTIGIKTYNPIDANIDRRARGESMDGWPEAEDEKWPDGSQSSRIYFTPARWEPTKDRIELRVAKSKIERHITLDKGLPPDVYIEGENLKVPPEYIEAYIDGKWVPIKKVKPYP